MGDAYQAACDALLGCEPHTVYEVLAKRILHATQLGERNVERLCEIALAGVVYQSHFSDDDP